MAPPPQRQIPAPNWLAHRYDPGHDAFQFHQVSRDKRRQVAFLTDELLAPLDPPVALRRQDVTGAPGAKLSFVFHSAYCCSTLIANAYDRPGRAFSLKEPVVLNDIVGWRHRGGPAAQVSAVLGDAMEVSARPFEAGERGVIKPSNVVNGLATALIAARPEAGVLLLHAPLADYLASIADKGLWGRLWVRDLLAKQWVDGLVELGVSQQDVFLQSDLQVAALGWLAQHALFAKIARQWPHRVRTLNSEVLLADPLAALEQLDMVLGIDSSAPERDEVVRAVFSRDAKTGTQFEAGARASRQEARAAVHAEELKMVMAWAERVADSAGVAMALPNALID